MEGRTVLEWDKDDIDALGILKVDVLGLGMLSCLRRAAWFKTCHFQVTPEIDRALTLKGFLALGVTLI